MSDAIEKIKKIIEEEGLDITDLTDALTKDSSACGRICDQGCTDGCFTECRTCKNGIN